MARQLRPYIMRGPPTVTEQRETIEHPADSRVPTVYPDPERALTPSELRMLARDTALDPRFRAVDRYLWRWAVGHGSGLPPEDPDVLRQARPSPLPSADSLRVDDMLDDSADWARLFVVWWFRSDASVPQIAERLGCRTRAVYDERKIVLAYFLGRLAEAGIRIPTWEAT